MGQTKQQDTMRTRSCNTHFRLYVEASTVHLHLYCYTWKQVLACQDVLISMSPESYSWHVELEAGRIDRKRLVCMNAAFTNYYIYVAVVPKVINVESMGALLHAASLRGQQYLNDQY
jgi:hypothetical protein